MDLSEVESVLAEVVSSALAFPPDSLGTQVVKDEKETVCAICLSDIPLEETAQVKGCDHHYCITCILKWCSTYQEKADKTEKAVPRCPQCKLEFTHLYTHRQLDGSLSDYLLEESVGLLLLARWFKGKADNMVEEGVFQMDDSEVQGSQIGPEDYEDYDDEDDDSMYYYEQRASRLRIGNRRWGENGFVSQGRQVARPVAPRTVAVPVNAGASSSSQGARSHAGSPTTTRTPNINKKQEAKKAKKEEKLKAKADKEQDRRAKRAAQVAKGKSPAQDKGKAKPSPTGRSPSLLGSSPLMRASMAADHCSGAHSDSSDSS